MSMLGRMYPSHGRAADGVAIGEKAVELARSLFGSNDVKTSDALEMLADAYRWEWRMELRRCFRGGSFEDPESKTRRAPSGDTSGIDESVDVSAAGRKKTGWRR